MGLKDEQFLLWGEVILHCWRILPVKKGSVVPVETGVGIGEEDRCLGVDVDGLLLQLQVFVVIDELACTHMHGVLHVVISSSHIHGEVLAVILISSSAYCIWQIQGV